MVLKCLSQVCLTVCMCRYCSVTGSKSTSMCLHKDNLVPLLYIVFKVNFPGFLA